MSNGNDKNGGQEYDPAVELIRNKLKGIYSDEPNAKNEIQELKKPGVKFSSHQEFINSLSKSGKSLAEIQTAWHNYYVNLPDDQKEEVWNEFYELSGPSSQYFHNVSKQIQQTRSGINRPKVMVTEHSHSVSNSRSQAIKSLKHKVKKKISANGKLKVKHHLQSLVFGISLGTIVLLVFMFSFFNEIIIAPLIQPSRNASTPVILSSDSIPPNTGPEIIIPKINLEIPVDYSQTSTNETIIESALNSGIVHYPNTVLPGQNGNSAFFGHSSNNIFNPGKYKFAFVLLHTLVPGDTFYLVYSQKVYDYQVFDKKIVSPNNVGVLADTQGKSSTVTLITCDPPGTSINRLVVWGEQLSPNPSTNVNSTAIAVTASTTNPTVLPGNGPSLWSRFIHWIF